MDRLIHYQAGPGIYPASSASAIAKWEGARAKAAKVAKVEAKEEVREVVAAVGMTRVRRSPSYVSAYPHIIFLSLISLKNNNWSALDAWASRLLGRVAGR